MVAIKDMELAMEERVDRKGYIEFDFDLANLVREKLMELIDRGHQFEFDLKDDLLAFFEVGPNFIAVPGPFDETTGTHKITLRCEISQRLVDYVAAFGAFD